MTSRKQNSPLPVAPSTYDSRNEAATRRTIELGFRESSNELVRYKKGIAADASLARRRFQFLLMGG